MRGFRANGGSVVARLDGAEAGIVGLLRDQLEQLLTADPGDVADDPVLARLLPAGHRSDPALAADYRDLTESALRSGKGDDLATMIMLTFGRRDPRPVRRRANPAAR